MKRKSSRTEHTKQYLQSLLLKDFLGRLSADEVEIAKSQGLLRWDLWKKSGRVVVTTMDQYKKGIRVAPVFDGSDSPDSSRYDENTKFLVSNYSQLAQLEAKTIKK